jgi:hypothetical protein
MGGICERRCWKGDGMSEDAAQTQITPAGQEEWIRGLCEKHAYLLRRCGELHDLADHARRESDEAQAAALNYWEAWQDAVDYWQDSRDEARGAARRIMARFAPRYEVDTWGTIYPWFKGHR